MTTTQKPIALVTGGSRGIGAATCTALAQAGYHVLVHYHRSAEQARTLAATINGTALAADMADDTSIQALFRTIEKEYGTLHLLVANAGIADCEDLTHLTQASFLRTLHINLWAPTLCAHYAVPLMPHGSIIFTSSICAQHPTPDALAYAASKAGLEAVMRSLAPAMAPHIRVNAVAPGPTETDMYLKNYTPAEQQWVSENTPLGRPCNPSDIADIITFLASEKAKNITGQVFTVDAGFSVNG